MAKLKKQGATLRAAGAPLLPSPLLLSPILLGHVSAEKTSNRQLSKETMVIHPVQVVVVVLLAN